MGVVNEDNSKTLMMSRGCRTGRGYLELLPTRGYGAMLLSKSGLLHKFLKDAESLARIGCNCDTPTLQKRIYALFITVNAPEA